MDLPAFSVLMSVYSKENPKYLKASLQSLLQQTLIPSEIVIVRDGPLTEELNQVLEDALQGNEKLFKIISLPNNVGLGIALQKGLLHCTNNYVARMDGDDIAVNSRFETQIRFLTDNQEVDVLGSSIMEFFYTPATTDRLRLVPETHGQIYKMAKIRNPINHMTVLFNVDKVKAAGGYQEAPFFEDYFLWIRMLQSGARFHNLQMPLVLARIGNDMVGKRHGMSYARHELVHFRRMKDYGFLTQMEYIKAIILRVPVRLVPKKLLSLFYKWILRK